MYFLMNRMRLFFPLLFWTIETKIWVRNCGSNETPGVHVLLLRLCVNHQVVFIQRKIEEVFWSYLFEIYFPQGRQLWVWPFPTRGKSAKCIWTKELIVYSLSNVVVRQLTTLNWRCFFVYWSEFSPQHCSRLCWSELGGLADRSFYLNFTHTDPLRPILLRPALSFFLSLGICSCTTWCTMRV